MKKYLPIILLIVLGLSTRLLPHLPNFTAIGAVAIFAGRYLPRRYALVLPLTAMFISDLFIGFYSIPMMVAVYSGFALMSYLGARTQNYGWQTVAGNTIVGSFLFYIITNWAVWAFGTMYPHTLTGLTTSYYLALPFWRNSLMADMFYTVVLVGGYELCLLWLQSTNIQILNNFKIQIPNVKTNPKS
ncbi:MAG: hypothetical protein A3J93_03950 [Candidatus Magasanikbacteria bacterium RIFOXYC2_FULL_42_28]|uniref:Rod shape-determining protein MreD n=1 Tax=Candidatus Magasanikbacteria bacterium RIFOXYC2_FULL_42_28 TaxID=1798704 RepID=A0A1F6NUP6_9BACT|nr:MAG: hypothetical protein A3J93_03950 [Candidatus Magasanikbacteria bacterium RIFOXYC2_FULL_42_28]